MCKWLKEIEGEKGILFEVSVLQQDQLAACFHGQHSTFSELSIPNCMPHLYPSSYGCHTIFIDQSSFFLPGCYWSLGWVLDWIRAYENQRQEKPQYWVERRFSFSWISSCECTTSPELLGAISPPIEVPGEAAGRGASECMDLVTPSEWQVWALS